MKHMHFSLPKDSKMNAEVVKAKFGHTQALGMKRSNGKRCPAEAVWLEERTWVLEVSFLFVWPHFVECEIFVPRPGIKPAAAEAPSPNHWTTREVPEDKCLRGCFSHFLPIFWAWLRDANLTLMLFWRPPHLGGQTIRKALRKWPTWVRIGVAGREMLDSPQSSEITLDQTR